MKIQISFELEKKKKRPENTDQFFGIRKIKSEDQINFWFRNIRSERPNQFLVQKNQI